MKPLTSRFSDSVQQLLSNVGGVISTTDAATAMRFGAALLTQAPQVLRTRNLGAVDRQLARRSTTYRVDGCAVRLSGEDFSGAREMYCRRVYFAPPKVRLRPGTTVIDLGSNVGLFTTLAARMGCFVLAVDAQAGFLAEVKRRAEENGCAGSVEFTCARVGSGSGYFERSADLRNASHYVEGAPMQTLTMSSFLDSHGVDRIGFLKVDIEGSEYSLFREYEPWMSRIDCLAMEVHADFGDPRDISAVLREAGLQTDLRDTLLRPLYGPMTQDTGYLYAWREPLSS